MVMTLGIVHTNVPSLIRQHTGVQTPDASENTRGSNKSIL